jgi:hypothetical protein
MGFKETFIGSGDRYDYGAMCVPQLPWTKAENRKKVNFYTKGRSCNLVLVSRFLSLP